MPAPRKQNIVDPGVGITIEPALTRQEFSERLGGLESRVKFLEDSGTSRKVDELLLIVKGDYVAGRYQTGLRDDIGELTRKLDETHDLAQAADKKADRIGPRITAGVVGVWAMVLTIVGALVGDYFNLLPHHKF